MIPSLPDAIAKLYRTFAQYRLGEDFTGCAHCVDPRDSARLSATPLVDLKLSDLDNYAFKAMTTWGTPQDFKHFLPRLFELAAENTDGFLSFEVLFSKLDYAKWEGWPSSESDAVNEYLFAFWHHVLDTHSEEHDFICTVLCALANARSSVKNDLNAWLNHATPTAYIHLACFVVVNLPSLHQHFKLDNPHWKERRTQHQEVVSWLATPAVLHYLEEGTVHLNVNACGIPLTESPSMLRTWSLSSDTPKHTKAV